MRKRIRSYLKGLAENRARAAGDVLRLEAMASRIAEELAEVRADLESCDRLIKKYDSRLRPELIEAVRAWSHHRGNRGDLSLLLAKIIAEAAPESLTLDQICLEVEYVWKLEFLTGMERSAWRRGSIARRLRDLVIQKKIVALHTKKGGDPTSEVARWKAI